MDVTQVIRNPSVVLGSHAWVLQVFVVVLATAAGNFATLKLIGRLANRASGPRTQWDECLFGALRKPAGVVVWLIGLSVAIGIIQLRAETALFSVVGPLRDVGIIACIAWFLSAFLVSAQAQFIVSREAVGETVDRTTVDAIGKLLRITVIVTAVLVALQALGYSVSGVLAFGGIGGLAVGLAAKDLLANFFGGAMVYMDRPFAVGDWIRSPEREIEGTVESIGWRLTRIRTFDQRPLYVPNAVFTQIAVENPSRMWNRRIFETVGLRYDDADRVGSIVSDVHEMLRTHDGIDQAKTLMVNFDKFAPSSLDFFIYCFTKTTEWQAYHAIKQEVLLQTLAIVARHGAEVAFPTSTVHVSDAIRVAAATGDDSAQDEREPEGIATPSARRQGRSVPS
jgi:MscS family membrane protein